MKEEPKPTGGLSVHPRGIRNVVSFPSHIKQKDPLWCIPASVEAVIKYHNPSTTVNQIWMVDEFKRVEPDFRRICFSALTHLVLRPKLAQSFEFSVECYPDVGQWLSAIRRAVEQDLPPLISYSVSSGFHINAVVAFTEEDSRTYDPDPSEGFPVQKPLAELKENRAEDILIIKPRNRPV